LLPCNNFRYGTVLYLLTQFGMPFLLIAILNTEMVNTIMKAKKQRALLTKSEKSEHKTALMMVLVVVMFVSCYTLSVSPSLSLDRD
jgi:2-oxo-4-hydroxy-4-carboxy--5-ureidoimidazoline (OHCU) decarboxylase